MRRAPAKNIGGPRFSPLALTMTLVATGCAPQAPATRGPNPPIRVSNGGLPFQMWEGALARKAADAACGGRVNVSVYDRFDRTSGEWVYPGGCA